MIVRDIMTTRLTTIRAQETLGHAVALFRQNSFHHLPVVRRESYLSKEGVKHTIETCEGILTARDVDLVAALASQGNEQDHEAWLEQPVADIMQIVSVTIVPTTTVAVAARLLVEQGLSCLPVVEHQWQTESDILVGLITRSDLLQALSRAMGAFDPGVQMDILFSQGDLTPLSKTLHLATQLGIAVRSIMMVAPTDKGMEHSATLRLSTINPTPLLLQLQAQNIHYKFG